MFWSIVTASPFIFKGPVVGPAGGASWVTSEKAGVGFGAFLFAVVASFLSSWGSLPARCWFVLRLLSKGGSLLHGGLWRRISC